MPYTALSAGIRGLTMSEARSAYIDHEGGRLERRVRGHEATPRMKEIGLAAVWRTGASWLGEFHATPGFTFELPPPLADWLLDPAQ